jgi:hypothetical protein
MRKYASGYFVIGVLAILGAVTIVISVIGGLAIAGNSPSDIRYIGWSIAIGGSIQGLLLIGLSTIGTAILDGSIAQQEANDKIGKLIYISQREEKNIKIRDVEKPSKPDDIDLNNDGNGLPVHASYFGFPIYKHPDGFMAGGKIVSSTAEAYQIIDIMMKYKNT